MIYSYLPKEIIPNDFENADFDEFFKIYAMAEIVRDLRIQDVEIGVNKGYVASFKEK